MPIEEDEFASARHARFEPRRDGVWVQDRGSTNGTYVNGAQLDRPRRLSRGRRRARRRDRPEVRALTLAGFAGGTDPGRRRRRNEDSYVIDPPLFAVADGMGGAQAGEVASKLAAGAVKEQRRRRRRACPGSEPARPPALARGPEHVRDGHDAHGRRGRGRRRLDRPRRRLARVPRPRRQSWSS